MCPSDSEPTRAWYRANSAMHSPGYTHALDYSIPDTTLSRRHAFNNTCTQSNSCYLDGFRPHVGWPNCAFTTASSIEKMITTTCDIQRQWQQGLGGCIGQQEAFFGLTVGRCSCRISLSQDRDVGMNTVEMAKLFSQTTRHNQGTPRSACDGQEGTCMYLTCSLCDPKCRSQKKNKFNLIPAYCYTRK